MRKAYFSLLEWRDNSDGHLYREGEHFPFDGREIPKERLEWEMKFMNANEMVNITMYENEVLGVSLPDKVELQIVECEEAVKGDTATSASKNAVVETGLEIKVPLFIKNGEIVVISTADGKYSGRA